MIIEFRDKYSLMISGDSKDDNSRNGGVTDGAESDSGFERRSCKSRFKSRKYIAPDNSSNVLSFANGRIGVTKHDSELYHWKITTDKDNNTGIHSTPNFIRLYKRNLKLCFNKKSKRNIIKFLIIINMIRKSEISTLI